MIVKYFIAFLIGLISLHQTTLAQIPALDFEVVKMSQNNEPGLLLMGGIQGDEPGGFNATNIFLMHYKITQGNVWVVPVLNRHSMLLNHRGIYDDMNRKFAKLKESDPEFLLIQKIKSLITNPQIHAILHLHDGSGFYRPTYINKEMNPNRWGACCIIDQEYLEGSSFPNLGEITNKMIEYINTHLINPTHAYHKRDTQTSKGDIEMEKALTYFAIRHQKSAFANEASKSLSLELRVYYHLLALEGLLTQLGIKFERDFKLTPTRLYHLINDQTLKVTIADKITLPLYGLREELNYFPLPKDNIFDIKLDSPAYIIGLLPKNNQVYLKYGNKLMTRLKPQFMDFDENLDSVNIEVDGAKIKAKVGSIIDVKNSFKITELSHDYRVNVIGFVKPNDKSKEPNESEVNITLRSCIPNFSIDKKGKIYRAEFYKGKAFAGMILFRFR